MKKGKHGASGLANNAASNNNSNSANVAFTEGKNSREVIFSISEAVAA